MWNVEYTDEFEQWWETLTEKEHIDIAASVGLLEERGPNLGYPHSSSINLSSHTHMQEIRIQHAGKPYRILYALDPRRTAILLIGGNKTGNNRWYETYVPIADILYTQHIATLIKEELIDE